MIRWVGFILIVFGGAASGVLLAADVRRSLRQCRAVQNVLAYMKAEIEFHLTPLDEITKQVSAMMPHPLSAIFQSVSRDIRRMPGVPAGSLMRRALNVQRSKLAPELHGILAELFELLGKQDVLAQVRAVTLAEARLEQEIRRIDTEKKDRCRTYRTIGICAGLAIAVVLI